MTALAPTLQAFFTDRLARQRHRSVVDHPRVLSSAMKLAQRRSQPRVTPLSFGALNKLMIVMAVA